MNGHLVTVEVGIERRADHRVKLDGFAFDENGFERLDRKSVQSRGSVEHDRLALGDFVEDIPDRILLPFNELLGATHGMGVAPLLEAANDERLEQHESHLLGKAALPELELGSADDDGTSGVVDAFAEEVLAETTRLALEHITQGLEGASTSTRDSAAMAAIVEHSIDGLLEHALFVSDNNIRRLELLQVAEAVVAVDDAAIEVVEIGGRKTSAFERNEGAQLGRDNRHDRQDHVLWPAVAGAEAFTDLHALGDLFADLLRLGVLDFLFELLHELFHVYASENLADALSAHDGFERIAVLLKVVLVFRLGEELVGLERGVARIGDEVILIVDDTLEAVGRHVKHEADTAR